MAEGGGFFRLCHGLPFFYSVFKRLQVRVCGRYRSRFMPTRRCRATKRPDPAGNPVKPSCRKKAVVCPEPGLEAVDGAHGRLEVELFASVESPVFNHDLAEYQECLESVPYVHPAVIASVILCHGKPGVPYLVHKLFPCHFMLSPYLFIFP